LSEHQLLHGLLAIAAILVIGRGTAEVARRLGQPEVLGLLLGGIVLGPSGIGAVFPELYHELFEEKTVAGALSLVSWMGAVLLLLVAGIEADLAILRAKACGGLTAAAFAIAASIAVGALFAGRMLHWSIQDGLFLGLVLSVTAVGVAATLLLERGVLRRDFAQVILAAGIASELLVAPFFAVIAALPSGDHFEAGLRSTLRTSAFIGLMLTVGRWVVFRAMRRVADLTQIEEGQLSLVLVLTFTCAAITQALGLHAVLGAFVFGVLLGQSPRATARLQGKLQTVTVGIFAPVFFVLAGMRVDLSTVGNVAAIAPALLLLGVATIAKVGLGALGARLAGLGTPAALLVGVGVNLKGGTDVIVAILGAELGLFSTSAYTLYVVVAIVTVVLSRPVMAFLEPKVPQTPEEAQRIDREEASRRAYFSDIERIVVPMAPELWPDVAAGMMRAIVDAKREQDELCDVVEVEFEDQAERTKAHARALDVAGDRLAEAGEATEGELIHEHGTEDDFLKRIMESAEGQTLIAFGARRPESRGELSLGELPDRIIKTARADVLVVLQPEATATPKIRRILVPVIGREYSLAAADLAAYLARGHGAELVLLHVVHSRVDPLFWQARVKRELLQGGARMLDEIKFRIRRLDIRFTERVVVGEDPAQEVLDELSSGSYQLLALGVCDRSADPRLYLGAMAQVIISGARCPTLLLVSHEGRAQEQPTEL